MRQSEEPRLLSTYYLPSILSGRLDHYRNYYYLGSMFISFYPGLVNVLLPLSVLVIVALAGWVLLLYRPSFGTLYIYTAACLSSLLSCLRCPPALFPARRVHNEKVSRRLTTLFVAPSQTVITEYPGTYLHQYSSTLFSPCLVLRDLCRPPTWISVCLFSKTNTTYSVTQGPSCRLLRAQLTRNVHSLRTSQLRPLIRPFSFLLGHIHLPFLRDIFLPGARPPIFL
ncbi:hypothetical protein F4680DRAFT_341545 [Xylaria scruposa]|nr:hypothetical protein F4680DRAFT_341545 [Xylaria scruposa]